jgi:hypothetical protein
MCSVANNFIDFGFVVLMDTVVADGAAPLLPGWHARLRGLHDVGYGP